MNQKALSILPLIFLVLFPVVGIYLKTTRIEREAAEKKLAIAHKSSGKKIAFRWEDPAQPFSAIKVLNDLYEARDKKEDFLQIFLARDFPSPVSDEQIESLRLQIHQLENAGNTPSINYKRGMTYFFLALAETQRLSKGDSLNPQEINEHWKSCLFSLRHSGDLQSWAADEVDQVVRSADHNQDGALNHDELVSIIKSHSS